MADAAQSDAGHEGLTPDQVASYLHAHPDFLERHVMQEVQLEQLERWMIRRTHAVRSRALAANNGAAGASTSSGGGGGGSGGQRGDNGGNNVGARKTSLSRWKFCVHADKRKMLIELQQQVQQRPSQSHVLFELATCIARAVDVDEFRLYIAQSEDGSRLVLQRTADCCGGAVPQGAAVAVPRYVASTRQTVRLSRGDVDPRFPEHAVSGDNAHVLCQPICQPNGELIAVLELLRHDDASPFYEEDEEIASSYLVWGGIALHYAHLFVNISHQRKLNDFLLCVVKSIFQDMVSMDKLVVKIMSYARRLVTADRASLFLVDSKTNELYATIFDVSDDTPTGDGNVGEEEAGQARKAAAPAAGDAVNEPAAAPAATAPAEEPAARPAVAAEDPTAAAAAAAGESEPAAAGPAASAPDAAAAATAEEGPRSRPEIRFPIGCGIAGQVALNGEILNIADAYADPRFNPDVDAQTGYRTNTILCMPIRIRGQLIGVMQMVNKRTGTFNAEDETAFETFSVYCGLALHHAKLYDKIRRSEQRYRVALEVLSYHNTCTPEEVQHCLAQGIPEVVPAIGQFSFNPFEYDDFGKAVCTIHMFIDLFGLHRFDKTALVRFTLTIRKNYRRVPYHNWTHGFSVANTMYSIIKNSIDAFRPSERLALFIGSLCHDLDHRGKNNKFMLDSASPIAAIYSTSTMEHHHFNQTVTILQQDGHNIFGKLSSAEYKQVLSLVKHCILATDLALFFPNKARLIGLIETEKFSWSILEHRMLIQAIAMTASDLSASAKPWDVQVKTVQVIFEEFYQQGDAEREAGRQPIAMMDRNQPDQQAASQVGFLNGICLPCYELLHRLIPETKPLLAMCTANLERWQAIAAEMQRKRDEQQQQHAMDAE